MKNNTKLISVVSILLMASLACSQLEDSSSTSTNIPIETPLQTLQSPATQTVQQETRKPTTQSTLQVTQEPLTQSNLSGCDNPLYPVKEGATWYYTVSGMASNSLEHSILEVTSDGFRDQDIFSDGTTRNGRWNCMDGDLISLDLNISNLAAANAVAGGRETNLEITSMDGVTIPADASEGSSWTQHIILEGLQNFAGQEMNLKLDITDDCKAAGVESITITAGTFTSQRVECKSTVVITVNIGGLVIPTSASSSSVSWYAREVGMVKTESDNGDGTTSRLELSDYTIP
ncbi:hypothetical protein ACFLTX_02495 [Chloroflexota bacterium]